MQTVRIPLLRAYPVWRMAARAFLRAKIPPVEILWSTESQGSSLFDGAEALPPVQGFQPNVPAAFLDLCETVSCHGDESRFGLLYKMLWRLQENPQVLSDESDIDVSRLVEMRKSVSRDCHKMKAFVRFREVDAPDGPRRRFAAWFEPQHFILERTAPFFVRRFADMDWLIATPYLAARFESGVLAFDAARGKPSLAADMTEDLWRTYYSSIFNPARLKVKAMQAEMPKKYWRNLPEAALIPGLIANAERRVATMREQAAAMPPRRAAKISAARPDDSASAGADMPRTLAQVKAQAASCTRCPLHACATQTVFGEGSENAVVMFVGEQPGDKEDLAGKPFVGPAGQLFNRILKEAGVGRDKCYVTNAVKHFKHELRGKFRLHKRPGNGEVEACRWWLKLEKNILKPKLIVALGGTAALAVTGRGDEILKRRGGLEKTADGTPVLMTIHPSALLRVANPGESENATRLFRQDLARIAEIAGETKVSSSSLASIG